MKKFKPPFDIDKIDKKYFKADIALYKLFKNKGNEEMTPRKYKSLPVEVEAIQLLGNPFILIEWVNKNGGEAFMGEVTRHMSMGLYGKAKKYLTDKSNPKVCIKTLEGVMIAMFSDYIIKGTVGEFYPCKKEIFEKKYREVVK